MKCKKNKTGNGNDTESPAEKLLINYQLFNSQCIENTTTQMLKI